MNLSYPTGPKTEGLEEIKKLWKFEVTELLHSGFHNL